MAAYRVFEKFYYRIIIFKCVHILLKWLLGVFTPATPDWGVYGADPRCIFLLNHVCFQFRDC
jgi:hypothetical protein